VKTHTIKIDNYTRTVNDGIAALSRGDKIKHSTRKTDDFRSIKAAAAESVGFRPRRHSPLAGGGRGVKLGGDASAGPFRVLGRLPPRAPNK
jgi:hypothetical protein